MKWLALLVLLGCWACSAPMGQGAAEEPGVFYDNGEDGDARKAGLEADDMRGFEVPAEPQAAPKPAPVEPAAQRQVIYSALMRLVVVSAREAHAAIIALAKQAGGYMQESDARSITIRVPAEAFESVIAKVAVLGEVQDSNIRAADVTEEMLDLGIRLENAKKGRERLLEHLSKSTKIEDTIKIEAELTRVTGEIEQMEGRLRFMRSQIAMSTIRVELNTNEPQRVQAGMDLPFEWVERLGDGLVAGTVKSMPKKPQFFARGPWFNPPPEFVRYYTSRDLVEAMNAVGVRLKLQMHDNYDEGALAFWSTLTRKALVQSRSLVVFGEQDLGGGRWLIHGTREIADQTLGYMLVIARTKSKVYTFEAWGPLDSFTPLLPALTASAKSLET